MSSDDKFVAYLLPKLRRAHHAISLGPGADRTLTNKCFLALSTAYFGVAHNDRPITEHGLRRYSRSLNELNLALRDPNSCRSFDVLEAVVIMAVMEVSQARPTPGGLGAHMPAQYLVSDNQHGWIMHTQGVEKLFQVRQPRHTTSLPCLLLLERTRPSMIFRAILLQQRTIMSLSDWKTIPWRDHPERADSMKHLLDIIADFPDLYCSRFEILTAGRSADGRTLPELQRSAFGLLQDLHEWRSAWAGHIRPSYVEANLDTPHFVDADGRSLPKWTTNIEYESLLHAQLMHFYYGAVILVGIFIRKGMSSTPDATVDISSVLREIHTSAAAICRGADYQIKTGQTGGTEHLSLFFPLRMAYEGIGQSDPVIAAWLGGCIARISSGSAGNWASARRLFQSGLVP